MVGCAEQGEGMQGKVREVGRDYMSEDLQGFYLSPPHIFFLSRSVKDD